MENFVKVKQASEVKLAGIIVEGALVDAKALSITLSDEEGNKVVFQYSYYSSGIEILVLKQPDTYTVEGQLFGLPISQTWLEKTDAEEFVDKIKQNVVKELYEFKLIIKRQDKLEEVLSF